MKKKHEEKKKAKTNVILTVYINDRLRIKINIIWGKKTDRCVLPWFFFVLWLGSLYMTFSYERYYSVNNSKYLYTWEEYSMTVSVNIDSTKEKRIQNNNSF